MQSVASASGSLQSDDFLSAGSMATASAGVPASSASVQDKVPVSMSAEQARSWCRRKRTLPPDITFQPMVEAVMACATRWRLTDECIENLLRAFCETVKQPLHDFAPSPYKLRKMMETRSSVTLQELPVCAKECSVYNKPFQQMTAAEINEVRCPHCAERYCNVAGKKARPEKVSTSTFLS